MIRRGGLAPLCPACENDCDSDRLPHGALSRYSQKLAPRPQEGGCASALVSRLFKG